MLYWVKHTFFNRYAWQMGARIFLFSVVLISVLVGAALFYIHQFDDRVTPGVLLAGRDLSGYTADELRLFLRDQTDRLIDEGWTFMVDTDEGMEQIFLSPIIVTDGATIEYVKSDIDRDMDYLLRFGKGGNPLERLLLFVEVLVTKPTLKLQSVDIDEERIRKALEERLARYESAATDASVIVHSLHPLRFDIVSSTVGAAYAIDDVPAQIQRDWVDLRGSYIMLERVISRPKIIEKDVEKIVSRLPAMFTDGSLILSYTDSETSRAHRWTISSDNIRRWLTVLPARDGGARFALREDAVRDFLVAVVESKVNVDARDAKFEVGEDGRVTEFQGSRPGKKLDIGASYDEINSALFTRMLHDGGVTKNIEIVVRSLEPNVSTGEVNEFGISEVLGIGISRFRGSPLNRIANIKNAVEKLNGIITPPGGEFSTIRYTKPFTENGGYLPELVIKGDELKPEIGGGLCQIGTTLFRMAMNSGVEITERRNHSLVVNYYNDLTNGLPGTDATLYDPAPDFRFRNDTEHAVLIQTEMDMSKGKLIFILWGTNDGRKGWYDPPVVDRWIPHGETKFIYTDKLSPGERKCQHAFDGAAASFTYHRILGNGEVKDVVFESYYRPLAEICLVGKEISGIPPEFDTALPEAGEILDSAVISSSE